MSRTIRIASLALVFSVGVATSSRASLINATTLVDTPEMWIGFIDWTTPVVASSVTLDLGPNWNVGVVEVPVGGGLGVLVVTARHLLEPHAPPAPAGLFLFASFGPAAPGAVGSDTDDELHEDDPGHFDHLVADLLSIGGASPTSRLNITLTHEGASVPVPEPATAVLVLGGLIAASRFRRRTN
jgi:hypothetical protein